MKQCSISLPLHAPDSLLPGAGNAGFFPVFSYLPVFPCMCFIVNATRIFMLERIGFVFEDENVLNEMCSLSRLSLSFFLSSWLSYALSIPVPNK